MIYLDFYETLLEHGLGLEFDDLTKQVTMLFGELEIRSQLALGVAAWMTEMSSR